MDSAQMQNLLLDLRASGFDTAPLPLGIEDC